MTHERIDEKAVFNVARGIDSPVARAEYLEQVCGDNPDARRRIEELLRVHEQERSFLESPPVALPPTLDQPPLEKSGTVIGPYKLVEQIGEGGMGVVFMAEQTAPVRRKVALKVIKPGMDTKQVIARFEAERQALAIMDHANIAKIHDAGATDSGRPYFVMELVRGVPIVEHCDQYRLDLKSRLHLFIDVCRAVQHAHQKGIIHRDLKPTNVLVSRNDTASVAKVIDFGIAKATGRQLTGGSALTGFKQLLGTPMYMSPEQAEMNNLDIDTRSDVYSLGVLLYELLTGHTPFDKRTFDAADYDELRRLIREVDPPRPSNRLSTLDAEKQSTLSARRGVDVRELSRHLRGELDWIVMKALEKDRARRYASSEDLARDVERYLHDQPVEACPPSAAYRCKKFAKRNKGVLSATGLVAAALLLGTGVSAWQAIRATEAEQLAEANADESETHRKLAEANALESRANEELAQSNARQAADAAAIAQAVNDFLLDDLLGQANVRHESVQRHDDGGGAFSLRNPRITVREVMDRAAKELEKGKLHDQPVVAAAVHSTLGGVYSSLDDSERAKFHWQRAVELREAHLGKDDIETLKHPFYGVLLNDLAFLYHQTRQYDKAEPLYLQAIAISQLNLNEQSLKTLADRLGNLACLYRDQGKYKNAESIFLQELEIQAKVQGDRHISYATTLNELAICYGFEGSFEKAEERYLQAQDIHKAERGERSEEYATVLQNRGLLYFRHNDPVQGEALYTQALDIFRAITGDKDRAFARHLCIFAECLAGARQHEKAKPLFLEALTIHRAIDGEKDRACARILYFLALLYRDTGDVATTESMLGEALEIYKLTLATDYGPVAGCLNELAALNSKSGEKQKAEQHYLQALEYTKSTLGDAHPAYGWILKSLASHYSRIKEFDKAEPHYLRALNFYKSMLESEHETVVGCLNELATLYAQKGEAEKAEQHFLEFLELTKSTLTEAHPAYVRVRDSLATYYRQNGKYAQAVPLLRQALDSSKGDPAANGAEQWKRLDELAETYEACGEVAQAEPLRIEARDLAKAQHGEVSMEHYNSLRKLGFLYRSMNDPKRASTILAEALAITEQIHAADHLQVMAGRSNLARSYEAEGRFADAEALWRKNLEVFGAAGRSADSRAITLGNLGQNLLRQKRLAEAESLLRESITLRESTAPDHWMTFAIRSRLGAALLGQQKLDEAEPFLAQGYEGLRDREARIPLQEKSQLTEALERLVQLFEAKSNPDLAARWRDELTKFKEKLAAKRPAPAK